MQIRIKAVVVAGALAAVYFVHAEEPLAFRDRMLTLHQPRLSADAAPAAGDEMAVDGTWRIEAKSDDPVVRHAAEDLADFFVKSMEVAVAVGDGAQSGTVEIAVDTSLKPLQCRIDAGDGRIRISGATPREAYQGCCRLEDEMGLRGRPVVKNGSRTYTRRFSPRMTCSGYGPDEFPDAYLDQIAHAGMDAILVRSATGKVREGLEELASRAGLRGIDVYVRTTVADGAALVKEAPGVKGVLVEGEGDTSGWAERIRRFAEEARLNRSDLDVVFSTIGWAGLPDDKRLSMVEDIPTNVTLLVAWDVGDQPSDREGAKASVAGRTLSVVGPGRVFDVEADAASWRGIRVMTAPCTAGRTGDFGSLVPFVPTPWRWSTRCETLRYKRARGLCALADSLCGGFVPGLVSELVKDQFTDEADPRDVDRLVMAHAVRDFGADAAPAAVAAWRRWSEAMLWHSSEAADREGPLRMGPAYALSRDAKFAEGAEQLEGEIKWAEREVALMDEGCAAFRGAITLVPHERRAVAHRALGLGEYMAACARTLLNAKRYCRDARVFAAAAPGSSEVAAAVRRMLATLRDEDENASRAIRLAEGDSSLGWDVETGYVAGAAAIREKLKLQAEEAKALVEAAKAKGAATETTDGVLYAAPGETVASQPVKGAAASLLPAGKKFRLVWNDEFDGDRLDDSKWSYRTNFWGQRFHAFAAPEDGCVEVSGGTVKLKVKKLPNGQFVSPQLQTGELMWDIPWDNGRKAFWPLPKRSPAKFLHRFGYYECRCRLQRMPGWWSAFWMQTETQGTCLDPARAGIEHDIMESFEPGDVSYHCFHMNGYGKDYKGFNAPPFSWGGGVHTKLDVEEFHTFGLLWEPDGYTLFVDGLRHGPKVGTAEGESVSQVPEFILISTECKWYRQKRMTGEGVPELEAAARANDSFEVDFVRVFDIVK